MLDAARARAEQMARNGWIEAVPTLQISKSGKILGYKQRFFRRDENGELVWHGESKAKPVEQERLPYKAETEMPF